MVVNIILLSLLGMFVYECIDRYRNRAIYIEDIEKIMEMFGDEIVVNGSVKLKRVRRNQVFRIMVTLSVIVDGEVVDETFYEPFSDGIHCMKSDFRGPWEKDVRRALFRLMSDYHTYENIDFKSKKSEKKREEEALKKSNKQARILYKQASK